MLVTSCTLYCEAGLAWVLSLLRTSYCYCDTPTKEATEDRTILVQFCLVGMQYSMMELRNIVVAVHFPPISRWPLPIFLIMTLAAMQDGFLYLLVFFFVAIQWLNHRIILIFPLGTCKYSIKSNSKVFNLMQIGFRQALNFNIFLCYIINFFFHSYFQSPTPKPCAYAEKGDLGPMVPIAQSALSCALL